MKFVVTVLRVFDSCFNMTVREILAFISVTLKCHFVMESVCVFKSDCLIKLDLLDMSNGKAWYLDL